MSTGDIAYSHIASQCSNEGIVPCKVHHKYDTVNSSIEHLLLCLCPYVTCADKIDKKVAFLFPIYVFIGCSCFFDSTIMGATTDRRVKNAAVSPLQNELCPYCGLCAAKSLC